MEEKRPTPQWYELFPDGVAICWLFDCVCKEEGQCHTCDTYVGYVEYCNTHPFDWREEEGEE